MLWQLAYAEIYFLNKLWPDFESKDLKKIVNDFSKVKRNFGAIQDDKKLTKKNFYIASSYNSIIFYVFK